MIRQIRREDVHRICSGQVVLSLSVALKEIVENGLDAGAKTITIKAKDYGLDYIEVADDGSGIEDSNFASLAKKHHTSKIAQFEDLETVGTFGFRGEALSSLCAVSELTVTTSTSSSGAGHDLHYDADGELAAKKPCARERGTTVKIANLFHSLPVRLTELRKHKKREFAKLVSMLQGYCMVRPDVQFSLTHIQGNSARRLVLKTRGGDASVLDVATALFGSKTVQFAIVLTKTLTEIKTVDGPLPGLKVSGYVSKPMQTLGRSSPDRQFFFINQRPCEFAKLSRAVNEAYRAYNKNQYPFVVAHLHMPQQEVDVNVTPDKRTLFFHKEQALLETTKLCITETIKAFEGTMLLKTGANGSGLTAMHQKTLDFLGSLSSAATSSATPLSSSSLSSSSSSSSEPTAAAARELAAKRPKLSDLALHALGTNFSWECRVPGCPKFMKNLFGESNLAQHYKTQHPHRRVPNPRRLRPAIATASSDEMHSGGGRGAHDDPHTGHVGDALMQRVAEDGDGEQSQDLADLTQRNANDDGQMPPLHDSQLSTSTADDIHDHSTPRDDDGDGHDEHYGHHDHDHHHDHCHHGHDTSDLSTAPSSASSQEVGYGDLPMVLASFSDSGIVYQPRPPERTVAVSWSQRIDAFRQKLAAAQSDSQTHSQPLETDDKTFTAAITTYACTIALGNVMTHVCLFVCLFVCLRTRVCSKDGNSSVTCNALRMFCSDDAEKELSTQISKDDFSDMQVIGQFNLGFIIARLHHHLFIVDQHASDEKYNFERLQQVTKIKRQVLIRPRPLDLPAVDENLLLDNLHIFQQNGFEFAVDEHAAPGKRVRLSQIPHSKGTEFGIDDIHELLFMLRDQPGVFCRPSRIRGMFASRACRSSIMIGKALTRPEMRAILQHMGTMEQPWNCPHGRPTMRHLCDISSSTSNTPNTPNTTSSTSA
ncbi:Pms2 protein [Salpingoeca rosetta]|uniref:Pms2 protein n=1 Tax=Salpingoeca rosetta (strain ATCC 50818 / BSB-021) TaxID=946362 RepID=F2U2I2_SALR5|nr:Pms2 protein [Salpingoeca rosetta]EGD81834.1 Pms2 protein [Salpingoeca rosetta]|eukprot:XP_004997038.1 Pms2 protein [Salpingoeca rosetta]